MKWNQIAFVACLAVAGAAMNTVAVFGTFLERFPFHERKVQLLPCSAEHKNDQQQK